MPYASPFSRLAVDVLLLSSGWVCANVQPYHVLL
jgi:hypothetical protein